MQLASRLQNLGTETAFAVSLAAAEWAAKGNRVYPFHLGDMNLPTPANVVDAMDKAIADGMTGYCAAAGIMPLREALAADVGARRGLSFGPENVVVQPGGKPVIGKFIQSVMEPGAEVLYPNPGYPIYESQIEYFGGAAVPYRYIETPTGFALDLEYLEAHITPRTTALIYNDLQNPLSAESSTDEMQAVADLAIRNNLWVLSDEAYFEMRYAGESHSIASLPGMQERTVILYTFSKKFAMTGWRLGAAIAPLQIAEVIAKLNTNDESCTAHFVQWAGLEGITGDPSGPVALRDVFRGRRDAAVDATNAIPGIHTARPDATFYLFANVTEAMQAKGFNDVSEFATAVLHNTGVSFCTRRHFGRPQPGEVQQYIRLAYSGISAEDITEGLGLLRVGRRVNARPTGHRLGTIVVSGKIPAPGIELLAGADHRVVAWNDETAIPRDELLRRVAGADVIVSLLTEKVDAELLDAAGPQLRAVCNVAVGYNNIDVEACRARGVIATNTPGVLTDATADIAMALILMTTRRLAEGERLIRSGEPWQWGMFMMLGTGLQGARLGLVGMGQIGTALARRARAFGMTIGYSNRRPVSKALAAELDAEPLSLDELLATSDVVSLHCPYSAETHHLISGPQLTSMRNTAYLINTARGPVVDEAALVVALERGELAGAGLDVFEKEPEVHSGLLDRDDVVLIPHLGSATIETRTAMATLAARNALAVLAGQDPVTPVT